jgi:hypothetical protein
MGVQEKKTGCLICGKEIVYGKLKRMQCYYCHKAYESNICCEEGHYVCDVCHSASANELIERFCISTLLEDPLEIALILMRSPQVKMHGPEHHFLVPASLLAAYFNVKKETDKKKATIQEAKRRAASILGGFCGFYGDCGAAVGTGIFISIITGATPLSTAEWRLSNLMTAKSLKDIANHGGPRCCKRNTYLAIKQATDFVKQNLDTTIKTKKGLICEFSDLNTECLKQECPYNPRHTAKTA